METCYALIDDYFKCTGKNGVGAASCSEFQSQLRKCEKSHDQSFCVNEVDSLVKCVAKPDSSLCLDQFVGFRECHRPSGPQIAKLDSDKYKIVNAKKSIEFVKNAADILSQGLPKSDPKALAKRLGIEWDRVAA